MGKRIVLITLLGAMAIFVTGLMGCGKSKQEQTAIQCAQDWLALVDKGKYLESWEGLADILKENTTKEQWVNDLTQSRKPLGKPLSRKLQYKNKSSEPSIGEYLIFQFQTSFETRKTVIEAVSVIKQKGPSQFCVGHTRYSGVE